MAPEPGVSLPGAVVLTPRPKQMGCGLVFLGLLAGFCLWMALGFYGVRDFKGVGIFVAVAAGIPIGIVLYMRNAQLFANPEVVGKRNLLGIAKTCPREEFDAIEPGRGTGPQLWFYRKDGKVAFTISSASWAADQIKTLTDYLGQPEIGPQAYLDALRRRPRK